MRGPSVEGLLAEVKALRAELNEQRDLVEMVSCMGRIGAWRMNLESGEVERTDEVFLIQEVPVGEPTDFKTSLSFYSESVRDQVASATRELLAEGAPFDMELPFITARGNARWVRTMGLAVLRDGKPTEVYGYLQDITDQKQAELLSEESQARLELVLDSAELGVFEFELESLRVATNRRASEMLGYTAGEIGEPLKDWTSLIEPGDFERMQGPWRAHLKGESPRFEAEGRMRKKSGEWMWVFFQAKRMEPNAAGRTPHVTGTFIDISKRKRAEFERESMQQQIQHMHKLESLGVLAGGIAHDFNNLLVSILGNAELALFDLSSASPVRNKLEGIIGSSQRAADLCSQMLAYSGHGRFRLRPIDLSEVVRETAKLLHASISKKAQLLYDLADSLPLVEADSRQIGQVIMNLITNASEAIGDQAGSIALRTGTIEFDEGNLPETYLDDKLEAGLYAYVEVEDTGSGMPPEVLAKVFDPFFTTKFTGRGLGMAVVLGIIRGHQGAILVESEVGRGTRFCVLFPVDPTLAAPRPSVRPEEHAWTGTGRVLVVDDEPGVLATSSMMLERLGFEAVTAADGQLGVERFAEDPEGFRYVLLDLTMPNMDGVEAYRLIREMNATVPILICSGYDESDVAGRFDDERVDFLQKPFAFERFRAALEGAGSGD